jgi:octaprenyl-diphosphate synthase
MQGVLDIPAELAPVGEAVGEYLQRIEACFDGHLASDLPPVRDLCAHIRRYRGKMLRPTLTFLSAMAASGGGGGEGAEALLEGASGEDLVRAGAVCEMIHMATLVHDDVLDEAAIRRRVDTVNRLRGNEAAVILGDYLIASAYHLCSMMQDQSIALLVAEASRTICAGELLQLHHRRDWSLDEATYFEIVDRKTAELVSVACRLGARIACDGRGSADSAKSARRAGIPRGNPTLPLRHSATSPLSTHEPEQRLADVGRHLGVAFQIQDDLLDLTGAEGVVGKSLGKDPEKGKPTLPVILWLAQASGTTRGERLRLLERGASAAPGAVAELARSLHASGAIDAARTCAVKLVERARALLAEMPASAARDVLDLMARAVVERSR